MLYRAVRKHQPDGLFCSLPPMYFSQPGAVNGPEEAIWHENGKQTKCLVNLASEEEIWRENRKAITSESQVTPYSKLAELLGKKKPNTDKPFCSSADAFAKGALLSAKQQFPTNTLGQISVHRPRICKSVTWGASPVLMRSWKDFCGKDTQI